MTRRREAFWPDENQEALLRAALLPGPAARAAWTEWNARNDFLGPHQDLGSFRLLPLVYRNLATHGVDDPFMPRLKGVYRFSWCANQRLFHDTAGLVEGLRGAGIRTLVLKGAAFSALYYRDAGVRPMSDVDVLVPPTQAMAAIDCLRGMGWRTTQFVPADLRYRHAAQLVSDEAREFDLHWHAFYECLQEDIDDGLWARAVPFSLQNADTLAMGPSDALLHTVAHGMRWGDVPTIRWIPDALAILRRAGGEVDWDGILREATRRRLILRFRNGLQYLRERFDAAVPEDALRCLRRPRPSYVERLDYRYRGLGLAERERLVFSQYPFFFIDYMRCAAEWSALRKVLGFPEYMRYRYRIHSRAGLVRLALRGVTRKTWRVMTPRSAVASRRI